jgi:hypothetical protein
MDYNLNERKITLIKTKQKTRNQKKKTNKQTKTENKQTKKTKKKKHYSNMYMMW